MPTLIILEQIKKKKKHSLIIAFPNAARSYIIIHSSHTILLCFVWKWEEIKCHIVLDEKQIIGLRGCDAWCKLCSEMSLCCFKMCSASGADGSEPSVIFFSFFLTTVYCSNTSTHNYPDMSRHIKYVVNVLPAVLWRHENKQESTASPPSSARQTFLWRHSHN